MSTLSQFFGGGGGVTSGYIRVEVFMVGGGGGGAGGGSYPYQPTGDYGSGTGGGGGVFVGYVNLAPGKTTPISVGAGGAGGALGAVGGNGSASSINTEVEGLTVIGGGGGAAKPAPGSPGGCGGGGYGNRNTVDCGDGGFSEYASSHGTKWDRSSITTDGTGGEYGVGGLSSAAGTFFGTPGTGGVASRRGVGGSALGSSGFISSATGETFMYATGGQVTNPFVTPTNQANSGIGGRGGSFRSTPAVNSLGFPGLSGIVVIKYPTQFASASSFPGATDVSPATPGFRTYKFTSSGSITLP